MKSTKIASGKVAKIKIKQIKGNSGRLNAQLAALRGLGLGRLGLVSELENTSAVRGMIKKVIHLVEILN